MGRHWSGRGGARRAVAVAVVLALAVAACGSDDDGGVVGEGGTDGGGGKKAAVSVGSVDFAENVIVAEMFSLVLEDAGHEVTRRFRLGTREALYPAVEGGDVDLFPEYLGTALEFLNEGAGEASGSPDETGNALSAQLATRDLDLIGFSSAQDQNTLVVTKETADSLGITKVSELEDKAGELTLGGPPECPERPFCIPGYESTYGIEFGTFKPLDAGGPLTKEALKGGDIDVALLFSSDGSIASNGWVVLEDDRQLQPADNIAAVMRSSLVDDDITALLTAVLDKLDTAALAELNRKVAEDKADPEDVAKDWLEAEGLITAS